jgi:hypothetical protein
MLESGDDLAAIRAFLGHKSFSSTLVYAAVTPELASKYLHDREEGLLLMEDAPAEKVKSDDPIAFLKSSSKRHF